MVKGFQCEMVLQGRSSTSILDGFLEQNDGFQVEYVRKPNNIDEAIHKVVRFINTRVNYDVSHHKMKYMQTNGSQGSNPSFGDNLGPRRPSFSMRNPSNC